MLRTRFRTLLAGGVMAFLSLVCWWLAPSPYNIWGTATLAAIAIGMYLHTYYQSENAGSQWSPQRIARWIPLIILDIVALPVMVYYIGAQGGALLWLGINFLGSGYVLEHENDHTAESAAAKLQYVLGVVIILIGLFLALDNMTDGELSTQFWESFEKKTVVSEDETASQSFFSEFPDEDDLSVDKTYEIHWEANSSLEKSRVKMLELDEDAMRFTFSAVQTVDVDLRKVGNAYLGAYQFQDGRDGNMRFFRDGNCFRGIDTGSDQTFLLKPKGATCK